MAKTVIFFRGTTWGVTDSLESLALTSTQWFGAATYYRVSTLDRAVALASTLDEDDEVTVAPEPPWLDANGNQQSVFFDAAGFPLQTVTVALGGNLTISRALTLAGGAYRLRLDGAGAYYIRFMKHCDLYDLDLVNLSYGGNAMYYGASGTGEAHRCKIINAAGTGTTLLGATLNVYFYDSLFVNCAGATYLAGSKVIFTRCTRYACGAIASTAVDGMNIRPTNNGNPTLAPADIFVDTRIPDDPSTVTDWSDATDWDFHLLSTSTFATGGTSVTSGTKVYGLDGLPRNVGGALGAYEFYAVDRWYKNGAWYSDASGTTTAAPTTTSVCLVEQNATLADDAATVSKYLVPGKTHVDLGNNGGGAELIIGLGATVTSSGSVTIKGETQTDAELWRRLTLEEGATLTLDDCATTDAA